MQRTYQPTSQHTQHPTLDMKVELLQAAFHPSLRYQKRREYVQGRVSALKSRLLEYTGKRAARLEGVDTVVYYALALLNRQKADSYATKRVDQRLRREVRIAKETYEQSNELLGDVVEYAIDREQALGQAVDIFEEFESEVRSQQTLVASLEAQPQSTYKQQQLHAARQSSHTMLRQQQYVRAMLLTAETAFDTTQEATNELQYTTQAAFDAYVGIEQVQTDLHVGHLHLGQISDLLGNVLRTYETIEKMGLTPDEKKMSDIKRRRSGERQEPFSHMLQDQEMIARIKGKLSRQNQRSAANPKPVELLPSHQPIAFN